ncbi:hypothetical protein CH063_05459 [Colletotrichum higginsianum]|uniref:Uncharacterized protein n=1 Tax=Colletotrichum higginsianum (strain IMI 349063) TaxID=759273 RepID=H1UZ32_COLHI|nr:hypothetical protein CH063_05459 [Colletotrichum higginsianum]
MESLGTREGPVQEQEGEERGHTEHHTHTQRHKLAQSQWRKNGHNSEFRVPEARLASLSYSPSGFSSLTGLSQQHASSRMDGGGKASAPLEHHLIAVILKGVGSG